MRKRILHFLLLSCLLLCACSKGEVPEPKPEARNQRTLLVYMPWATNLYSALCQNLSDLLETVNAKGLDSQRIVVFLADGQLSGKLMEVEKEKSQNGEVRYAYHEKKTYNFQTPDYTTVSGLSAILTDMVKMAPAEEYSLIVGCHGMGWVPISRASSEDATRWFGGASALYQTEMATLKEVLQGLNLKLQFLLFDDCYMANVEVAYELKDVTRHLIASTCEVMSYGMPYHTLGKYLLGSPDYAAVCQEFLKFYGSQQASYGTLSVISTDLMERVAQEMKSLNAMHLFDYTLLPLVQKMDGYSPTIFFDMGDYVQKLAGEDAASLLYTLQMAVPYKCHTPQFFSANTQLSYPIESYSGLTISDPSENTRYISPEKKESTDWWKATH